MIEKSTKLKRDGEKVSKKTTYSITFNIGGVWLVAVLVFVIIYLIFFR